MIYIFTRKNIDDAVLELIESKGKTLREGREFTKLVNELLDEKLPASQRSFEADEDPF